MIPEIGQLALILALGLALVQGVLPIIGAAKRRLAWMAIARPAAQGQFAFVSHCVRMPGLVLLRQRLFRAVRGVELQLEAAARLPVVRHLGRT